MSKKNGIKSVLRLFSGEGYKGSKDYIHTQRVYEILRTVLYFGIALALFAAGYIATGDKLNLLTVVAVLGCLPASKSAVSMIMFLRYKGLSRETAAELAPCEGELSCLYDMVFTSYSKTFEVGHMAVRGNTVCGYSEKSEFPEKDFQTHLEPILKADGHKNVTVKIFTDLEKYKERLRQLQALESETGNTEGIVQTLKSVVL
ncbi:MAG: hypothetical protein HDR02_18575 [Lachnospiraceae bacterium]|nr:hypothetical protein [Lachnospiraceae bacterium]